MIRRLTVAAIVLGIPLIGAEPALACSCLPLNVREQLKSADGAFVGRLVAVREVDPPADGQPISSVDPVDYVYRVGRVYKRGPGLRRGHRVRVRSARGGASCGLPDVVGGLIGILAERRNRRWHSGLCLTTTPRRLRHAAGGTGAKVRPDRLLRCDLKT